MSIYDPLGESLSRPKRWKQADHSEPIEYTDTIDPMAEDRTIARTRVKRGFEKLLDQRLDEMYGSDEGRINE